MNFFDVRQLSAGYGKGKVLRDISFLLEPGCVLGILGANGCGKTTLMKAICGILPHEGICRLEGTTLEGLSARQIAKYLSYIPQRSGISIDMTALDVALMGFNPRLGLLEHPTKAMVAEAKAALAQVGLSGMEENNYINLSEGQKQLCILARTMVSGSRLLLLDEPESALDFRHRYRMLELVRDWVNKAHGGAVVALHDPVLALNRCDRLLVLKDGRVLDTLCPRQDSLGKMEQVLGEVYGPVSLHLIKDRAGRTGITMLKEGEE